MNIGLIGTGSIGNFLLQKINKEKRLPGCQITAVFDEREKAKMTLPRLLNTYRFTAFHDVEAFLKSDVDIVVECANIEVVRSYAAQIVQEKDLLLISVGALADITLYEELKANAKAHGHKIYLPAGAIGGLDAIRAAQVGGGLRRVSLETRKPANSLSDQPFAEETVLFEGSAKEAIHRFPQNANVAIILALAGVGIHDTDVRIIADPQAEHNIHMIQAIGDFGKLTVQLENHPSTHNPKTSQLTGLSILAALQSLDSEIQIG
ncbi:aspartate dehydrogenase [Sporosarcina sp. FSL W7-1349]|uniref:aspartate dehydrogenase n=1 Tax=Bacillales TaxID=1385 RepID=UPI000581F13F|nr:aspartate dehydrogenase [Bacillus sp. OxB-1]BAQ11983.1 aspartame dehydrogenase [Bacillus sp. OxB-1]